MNARFRRSQDRWVSIQKEKQRFTFWPALCAALQPMFCHLFSKTSGPFFQKPFQKPFQKRPKIKKAKTWWKSQKCFEECWKSNPNPKKGPPPSLLGMRNLAFIMFGASLGMKEDFLFYFFSDFGNLVRRNVQNIDLLEYFDYKSDVYSTNRA